MSRETPLSLPVIDFCKLDLKPGTTEWDSLRSQVWKAIEEYGSFRAVLSQISQELREAFLNELEELFALPLQIKRCYVNEKPFRGYVGQSPSSPLNECFTIDDPVISQNLENLCNILWQPQGKPSFRKIIHSFSKEVLELEKIIRTMIIESLGVEKYLEENMDSADYMLRVTKYGSPQTSNELSGLRAHTDKNMITILHQNEVDGLEVQTKGGEWIQVKFSPESFVILIGESFDAWANGRLHSPYHRVRVSGNEARISAGFFSVFKAGYLVKAPEEMVDEEYPLLFKPFDYSEFIKFFQTPAGRSSPSALKEYCGV
ncbi:hypothetical protein P3X46_001329 [Hevea brasiliensis]|uniref:Fe2OG dioxygenase domain-containing protein n=1 Tax=Hevea brasiliensis TaxID=3981 RepID=A0ABQ9NCC3_HEVBR|nr:probable 2-oxoglutarate-dependent dioxygenase AOP1 [Hevea brasiliensis]KAJ9190097.1 hypothetical protein P3X46_001329 [Hevea brasiliensis]